jgi:beta-lactamase regulating signal transducer with metallopeptidase domain
MDIRLLLPLAGVVARGANVVGAWLLTYAVHSTVLLLAAWCLVSLRRLRWSPAAQHTIWRVALVSGVVTATVQVASPWPSVGGALHLTEGAKRALAAVQVTQQDVAVSSPTLPLSGAPLPLPAWARDAATPTSLRLMVFTISRSTIAVVVWGVVAVALLGHLALARRRLASSLAARRNAVDSLAATALRHLRSRAGVDRTVALSTSDTLQAPAAISSDEIVLPTRALRDLTLAEQEGVLAHELAHVVRHDTGWLRLAVWIERLAWFQPLNRVARRQMQLSAEFAADAWAVQLTRQPITLAQALARVAGWLVADRPSPSAFAPGADGSPLVERVRRLTSATPERPALGGRAAHGAMLVAAASALALLPRVDLGVSGIGTLERREQVEFRIAEDDMLRAHGLRADGMLSHALRADGVQAPQIRILRMGDSALRLIPASLDDSVMARRGTTRVMILTSRAAS